MSHNIFKNVLLVSDIDGTLSYDKFIPERNIQAIHRFIQKGGNFVIATGRNLSGAKVISHQLNIEQPIICLNGGCIYDLKNDSFILDTKIDSSVFDVVKDIQCKFPSVCLMYSDVNCYYVTRDNDYVNKERTEVHNMLRELSALKEVDSCDVPTILSKALLWDYKQVIDDVEDYIKQKTYENLDFIQSGSTNVEIIPKNVSKGKAVQVLANALGIKIEDTCCIGDYYNDVSMLKIAGHPCTTSQAPEDIKSICKKVTGPCENGAVADFIEYLEEIYSEQV